MFPDTLEDLFLTEGEEDTAGGEYERHGRYLDRCRRVRLSPSVVVVFENARTLQFRVQELARVARYVGTSGVSRELRWYRSLLPARDRLLASVTVRDRDRGPAGVDGRVYLRAGDHAVPGLFLAHAAGDRIIGHVRWAEFHFTPDDLAAVADPFAELVLGYEGAGLRHEARLDPPVRTSLLADLGLPDGN